MSAQDLEQRARALLPELPSCADAHAIAAWGPKPDYYTADQMRDYATSAIVAALRQQPAPVDLEQFREAVDFYVAKSGRMADDAMRRGYSLDVAEIYEASEQNGKRLLSIIDNAGKVECAKPAHVVDDVMVDAAIAAQDAHWANDANYPARAPRSVKGDAELHDKLARGAMRDAIGAVLERLGLIGAHIDASVARMEADARAQRVQS